MGPLFAAWLPLALTSIILILIIRIQDHKSGFAGRPAKISSHDLFAFVLLGVLGKGISMVFGTWAVRLTLASDAALVNLSLPICTAVMAFFILGERMNTIRIASFVMAILGVLLCSGVSLHGLDFSGRKILIGNAFCFLAVSASAFGNTYSKTMLDRFSVMRILLYMDGVGALFLFPLTLYLEPESFRNFIHFSAFAWTGLLFLTLMRNLVAVMLFLEVLKRLDATVAGLSHYLMPFFGIITSAMFLGEKFTGYMLLGGLVVLCSTLMTTLSEGKYKREESGGVAAVAENSSPGGL